MEDVNNYLEGESKQRFDNMERYLDEQDRRHYQTDDGETDVYSVTTILGEADKGDGLKWWKRHNDGLGDNPFWKHLLQYKQNLGTLAHYNNLAPLQHPDNPENAWTEDESSSREGVDDLAGDPNVLYSLFNDRGWVKDREAFEIYQDNEDKCLYDVFIKDMNYIEDKFDEILDEKGIEQRHVENVETKFIVPEGDDHAGYGGQVDLIYEDPETGESVVADLKTSSKVRTKHRRQAAAYSYAAENHPDLNGEGVARAEIWRINPENKEKEVYQMSDWESYFKDFADESKKL